MVYGKGVGVLVGVIPIVGVTEIALA